MQSMVSSAIELVQAGTPSFFKFIAANETGDTGGPYLYDKVNKTFHQGATSGLWDVGEVGEPISLGMKIIVR